MSRRDHDKLVDVDAELRAETHDAWLIFDGKIETWVPKSLVERSDDGKVFTMPEWLAIRERLA